MTNIKTKKKLLIISHTEHYCNAEGIIVGWGSTVREINSLAKEVTHIYHIACFYSGHKAPKSSLPYAESNVTFVPIPPSGGAGVLNKLKILLVIPIVLFKVVKYLGKVDVFQLRLPTAMGVYLLPFFTFFVTKSGWIKYAGNWIHKSPPLSYRLQRFWLIHIQRRKVTINGKWENQPAHCISFENPCLTEADRIQGLEIVSSKQYNFPLVSCFAGRLEDAKGVNLILEALKGFDHHIGEMHFIGDGPDRKKYEMIAGKMKIKILFHGFLDRQSTFDLFAKANLFLLPSLSEGFPKVIAEAANFGCVPITSNVSSIPQYVSKNVGYVWHSEIEEFSDFFNRIQYEKHSLSQMGKEAYNMAGDFTFSRYQAKIVELFLET